MLRKVRLSESVVNAIKEMIADHGYAPGDKFLSEKELTEKLAVSRSSVREAVRVLEAMGAVTVKHGKGIFIADHKLQPVEAFTDWIANNKQSIRELFEVRLIIEPTVARFATQRAASKDIAAMEEACRNFEHHADLGDATHAIEYDREFHKLLARAAGNKTLKALMTSLATSFFDGWLSSLHTPGRMLKTVTEHRVILQAVKDKDPDAAHQAMASHLQTAVDEILSSIKPPRSGA